MTAQKSTDWMDGEWIDEELNDLKHVINRSKKMMSVEDLYEIPKDGKDFMEVTKCRFRYSGNDLRLQACPAGYQCYAGDVIAFMSVADVALVADPVNGKACEGPGLSTMKANFVGKTVKKLMYRDEDGALMIDNYRSLHPADIAKKKKEKAAAPKADDKSGATKDAPGGASKDEDPFKF